MIPGHRSLEADDVLLGSFRAVIFFQVLVDAVEQVRVITLESPCGM